NHLAPDQANWSAFRIGADGSRHAHAGRDIHAPGNDCLDGFSPALRIENVNRQTVLLENAAALAQFRNASVPRTPLGYGNSDRLLGVNHPADTRKGGKKSDESDEELSLPHRVSSQVFS